ncbi:MAG: hypothetical protein H6Q69_705 [Firmicutes bacterium]|nr:hypothetical protein [Bacillota bacterium]
MRIFLIGPDFFNYTQSLENAFQQMGHQTVTQTYRNFWDDCSYFTKKTERWGITSRREQYYRKWNEQVINVVTEFNPERIIVLNGEYLSQETMDKLKGKNRQTVLWLIDSILRFPHIEKVIHYYDKVFSFDPRDEKYLMDKYKIGCPYLPVGYDPEIYKPGSQERDIDICFVGNATANRIAVLRRVAEYACGKNIKFTVVGKYWSDRYFWKKRRFARKYEPLGLFVQNKAMNPIDVAKLYQRTKICLNIHISDHDGINPRLFEIMGTKSMELVDYKPKLMELIDIDNEVAVYQDADDLINKIEYYLNHSEERENIAAKGYKKALEQFTIRQAAAVILNS